MKNLSLMVCLIISTQLFAANIQDWKPKYRLQKLDKKATITKSKNDRLSKKVKADRVSVKSSSVSRANSKTTIPMRASESVSVAELESLYKRKYKKNAQYQELKNKTLALTQKAVPTLIKVVKSSDYPDKNRWIAMFMLGRVMGKKSANFISKFSAHPNWMLRLASLKVLLALQQKQYKGLYTRMLKDKAMIVRHQALENIKQLDLKELAPYVWAMLYDKSNYAGSTGARKKISYH
jgi:HEAT repeat protein